MEFINASPFIERSSDSIWDRATKLRDRVHVDLLNICSEHGVTPLLMKSNPSTYPLQVQMELWVPQHGTSITARSKLTVTFQPKPYHRCDMEIDLAIISQGRNKSYKRLRELTKAHLNDIVLYFLGKMPRLKFPRNKLRRFFFQLWRPKNKISFIRPDWTQNLAWALTPILVFGHYNFTGTGADHPLIEPERAEALAGIFFKVIIIANIIAIWRLYKRPRLVLTTAKPHDEPRLLLPFDYWQTVIFEMADECENLQNRFIKVLQTFPSERFRWKEETLSYLGLDTLEERSQYVITFNRAILFVQIHQYGEGLYIGWDAHLNFGHWIETPLANGVHKDNGRLTSVQSIVAGDRSLCEYDLADLNCLLEWSHGSLTKMIKGFMAEKTIDQEIDFKILRGDRERILTGQRSGRNRTFESAWRERDRTSFMRERWARSSGIGSRRSEQRREDSDNR